MIFDLAGRTALVTGAGQSVGEGIAHALAAQGAHVLVNDVVAERADTVVAAIGAAGGSAAPLAFDVTDLAAVLGACADVPIDVVVKEMHKYSGTQFDPVVVDAFLKLLDDEGDAFISKDQKFDIYAFIEG